MFRKLLLTLLLVSPWAQANHEASEPSDGTVNSFKPVQPPRQLEPVKLLRNADRQIDTGTFRGRLVLLNLWATWCPPCIRELPALDRLQQRLGSDRFEVVTVALDEGGYPAARAFFDKLDIEHLTLYSGDTAEFARVFPVDVFPASFFIDPQGRVLSYLRSYADWDDPAADALVRRYLAESADAD